eukprot:m.16687 g.16687  ORF g.16687 m.16687 type:complete len:131 (+) comp5766_c0_seq2:505-897(+)
MLKMPGSHPAAHLVCSTMKKQSSLTAGHLRQDKCGLARLGVQFKKVIEYKDCHLGQLHLLRPKLSEATAPETKTLQKAQAADMDRLRAEFVSSVNLFLSLSLVIYISSCRRRAKNQTTTWLYFIPCFRTQ